MHDQGVFRGPKWTHRDVHIATESTLTADKNSIGNLVEIVCESTEAVSSIYRKLTFITDSLSWDSVSRTDANKRLERDTTINSRAIGNRGPNKGLFAHLKCLRQLVQLGDHRVDLAGLAIEVVGDRALSVEIHIDHW